MSLRATLEKNKPLSIGLIVVIFGVAAYFAIFRSQPEGPRVAPPQEEVYYYDLGSKELFNVKLPAFPPVEAPSGHKQESGQPGGVRAHLFSCGECNKEEQFIGYLENMTKAAHDVADLVFVQDKTVDGSQLDLMENETMVKAPEEGEWVSQPKGLKDIMDKVKAKCKGQIKRCLPVFKPKID